MLPLALMRMVHSCITLIHTHTDNCLRGTRSGLTPLENNLLNAWHSQASVAALEMDLFMSKNLLPNYDGTDLETRSY